MSSRQLYPRAPTPLATWALGVLGEEGESKGDFQCTQASCSYSYTLSTCAWPQQWLLSKQIESPDSAVTPKSSGFWVVQLRPRRLLILQERSPLQQWKRDLEL